MRMAELKKKKKTARTSKNTGQLKLSYIAGKTTLENRQLKKLSMYYHITQQFHSLLVKTEVYKKTYT